MISLVFSIWTVVACVVFCAIVVWAWSSKRSDDFDAAARLALDPDEDVGSSRDG